MAPDAPADEPAVVHSETHSQHKHGIHGPDPAPILCPDDVRFLTSSLGRKLLDASTTVVSIAARNDASQPLVVECYPLRTPVSALSETGKPPGGGSLNKWVSAKPVPW